MVGSGGRNDLCVAPHPAVMHYALSDCKRLLHYGARYHHGMSSPNERLRIARERHFGTAVEAADALGIPRGTYLGHENGHRGFPAKRAPAYARKFKVSECWLLYGTGDGPVETAGPTEDELALMIDDAQDEMGVRVSIEGWSRAVAASLRTQLERYQADRASRGGSGLGISPGRGAPPLDPTKPGAPG